MVLSICGCNNFVPINNIESPPRISKSDSVFVYIYKPLEGTWKGDFLIYEDTLLVNALEMNLKHLSPSVIMSKNLKLINPIQVEQKYVSESPFFQKVIITDFYLNTGITEVSLGVNKIQNGELWCVVQKPNDTVIQKGSLREKNTIIWQSHQESPQKVEFFQETFTGNFYDIIGYGYYEGDNLSLSHRLWFYAKYEKQNPDI